MDKTDKKTLAGYWIRRFLCEFLTDVRNLSSNTQKAYRDTLKLFVIYLGAKKNKNIDALLITDLTSKDTIDFLDYVERERKCSVKTRNLRLAAIVSFAKHVAARMPEYIDWCGEIRAIPLKKSSGALITYLEKKELDTLLNLPDQKTKQGWRDYVLLLFLYNTGTRASEAASLQIKDLSIPRGKRLPTVTVHGKGNKTRRCPLWSETVKALGSLIEGRNLNEHVFLNRYGQAITRFGIYEMVTKYAKELVKIFPTIDAKRLTPHTIRHTTATHLLQAGVDINTIRAWLGHVSVETTNVYVEISMQMKAKALESCKVSQEANRKHWREDTNLMTFLESI